MSSSVNSNLLHKDLVNLYEFHDWEYNSSQEFWKEYTSDLTLWLELIWMLEDGIEWIVWAIVLFKINNKGKWLSKEEYIKKLSQTIRKKITCEWFTQYAQLAEAIKHVRVVKKIATKYINNKEVDNKETTHSENDKLTEQMRWPLDAWGNTKYTPEEYNTASWLRRIIECLSEKITGLERCNEDNYYEKEELKVMNGSLQSENVRLNYENPILQTSNEWLKIENSIMKDKISEIREAAL